MMRNNLDHGMEVPEMVLLVKDHKSWPEGKPVPTRPVVSGNRGINTHLSELLSEILEPATNFVGGAEILSTEEALQKINCINDTVLKHDNLDEINAIDELANHVDFQDKLLTDVLEGLRLDKGNEGTQNDSSLDHLKESVEPCVNKAHHGGNTGAHDNNSAIEIPEDGGGITSFKNLDRGDYRRDGKSKSVEISEGDAATTTLENFSNLDFSKLERSNYRKDGETKCDSVTSAQMTITNFFERVEVTDAICTKNFEFSKMIDEENHRNQAKIGRDFNSSIKHNCIAGLCWNDRWDKEFNDKLRLWEKEYEKTPASESIQDMSDKPILFGADVNALYPSLEQVETAILTGKIVLDANIEFRGLNFNLLMIYLYLTLGTKGMNKWGLSEVIPRRKFASDSVSLHAKSNRNEKNWEVIDSVNPDLQRKMIAAMVHVMTMVMMQSSCYTFGGEIYLQTSGSGIGLRGSACVAKLIMTLWDKLWGKSQQSWKLVVNLFMRYIDDIRIYMKPIRKGWYWHNGWKFDLHKVDDRDPETRTKEEMNKSFNEIIHFLKFTTEGQQDFPNNYLPTLDFQTQVGDNGLILYKHFDKPMTSNLCIQNGTALSKTTIFSSLRQDLCRRLLNTSVFENENIFFQVVSHFIQRMVNGGHKYSFIKSVVLQAITRHKYMQERDKRLPGDPKYQPLYRSKLYKRDERMILKRIEFCTWYKDNELGDPYRKGWKKYVRRKGGNIRNNLSSKYSSSSTEVEKKFTTVLFVPATIDSQLMNMISEEEEKISKGLNWNVKILEKSGTPLNTMLTRKFPIKIGCPYGTECSACDNDTIKCTPKGIVYRAKCMSCSAENEKKPPSDVPENNKYTTGGSGAFIYIGESGRTFRQRVREHMSALRNLSQKSFDIQRYPENLSRNDIISKDILKMCHKNDG